MEDLPWKMDLFSYLRYLSSSNAFGIYTINMTCAHSFFWVPCKSDSDTTFSSFLYYIFYDHAGQ